MKNKTQFEGIWVWRFIFGRSNLSLYTIHFDENAEFDISCDTPAMDVNHKFLFCTSARKLKNIHDNLLKQLASVGAYKNKPFNIDVLIALKGIQSDKRKWEYWSESIDFINLLLDYLNFLHNDDEEQKRITLLGQFCDHMLLADDLSSFYSEHNTSRQEIIQTLLYCCYRVYQNSRVV